MKIITYFLSFVVSFAFNSYLNFLKSQVNLINYAKLCLKLPILDLNAIYYLQ